MHHYVEVPKDNIKYTDVGFNLNLIPEHLLPHMTVRCITEELYHEWLDIPDCYRIEAKDTPILDNSIILVVSAGKHFCIRLNDIFRQAYVLEELLDDDNPMVVVPSTREAYLEAVNDWMLNLPVGDESPYTKYEDSLPDNPIGAIYPTKLKVPEDEVVFKYIQVAYKA